MRWGVALNVRDRVSESLRKAKAADQGGIDQVWITDFPAMRYAPAVAAAVAEGTSHVE
jgi:alkanesulfonate monooxygenase SsuD/methylene tetrahydromethanopterin reductase-like flavin-dependent oxidoreductase (luciferase family)